MKRITFVWTSLAVLFTNAVLHGQQTGPDFEHLKPYDPMIGTWRYEGPLLEEIPGIAEKGREVVLQFSWRRILDRNAVMEDWSAEIPDGPRFSGRALIGWNAANKQIVSGSVASAGGVGLGTIVFDPDGKTSRLTAEGVDSEGKRTSLSSIVTIIDRDTITWKAEERTGPIIEGPSPIYTLKRVSPPKGKKAPR